MKYCRNVTNVFRRWKTSWRFAEFVAKCCDNSPNFPKPNQLPVFIYSFHFFNSHRGPGDTLPRGRERRAPEPRPHRRVADDVRPNRLEVEEVLREELGVDRRHLVAALEEEALDRDAADPDRVDGVEDGEEGNPVPGLCPLDMHQLEGKGGLFSGYLPTFLILSCTIFYFSKYSVVSQIVACRLEIL